MRPAPLVRMPKKNREAGAAAGPGAGGHAAAASGGEMAVVVKTVLGSNGVGEFTTHFSLIYAPPILEPILVGIGMFTGGTDFDPWPNDSSAAVCALQGTPSISQSRSDFVFFFNKPFFKVPFLKLV